MTYLFLIVLLIISIIIAVIFTVYFAVKEKGGYTKTNYDMCLEKEGVVVETISNLNATGQVKVNGQLWSARSDNDKDILSGKTIIVKKIDGVKLIVTEKSMKSEVI